MAEAAAQKQTVSTQFLTWHNSNGDVHIRTSSAGVLYIDKKDATLVERAKTISRGQKITVTGVPEWSKTLSSHVLRVESLETA
jgi:hypothetical protein